MNSTKIFALVGMLLLTLIVTLSMPLAPAQAAKDKVEPQRLLVDTSGAADRGALRAEIERAGNKVVIDMPEVNMMVVYAKDANAAQTLAQDSRIAGVARDGIRNLVRPELKQEMFGKTPDGKITKTAVSTSGAKPKNIKAITPDTAFWLPGLMWDYGRIAAPKAWNNLALGLGYEAVKVGVADTGLDYTHIEMTHKIADVVDFTQTEDPPICQYFFGLPSDQELADFYGGPADTDWNGHGSWIGGNIAAAMHYWDPSTEISGTNGIAPAVELVALKISQNCGSAYDSEILSAFTYAANHGIDVVSISFGGYLDRSNGAQDLIYKFYQRVVNYAWDKGTIIIASAGNEHTKIGSGGRVTSHGILDVPPGGTDYFGLWEVPGGVPHVVDVSATGNVVKPTYPNCPADSLAAGNHQWCKPSADAHQPYGVGKRNQLTYYSNYGPRIDFAAPGGSRKFNVPAADRGGTEGWPWTGANSVYGGSSEQDGYNAWQTFSITSNWATQIPCFTFTDDPLFPDNNCYAIIQGTSMATPHVSAAAAVVLSNHPEALKNPGMLFDLLKAGARPTKGNTTPPVSGTDTSNMDRTNDPCPGAYCHLGGSAISDSDAYGNGLINVYRSAR